jgi:hypothetical protein
MLERPPRSHPQRRRQQWAASARRVRTRQQAGLRSRRLDRPDVVVQALIAAGRLTEQDALSDLAVNRALSTLLLDWATRWTK